MGEAFGRNIYRIYFAKGSRPMSRHKVLCKASCNFLAWAVTHSWTAQCVPRSPINQPNKSRGRSYLFSAASGEQIAKRQQLCSPQQERKCQTSAGKLLSDTEPFSELSSGCGGRRWEFPPSCTPDVARVKAAWSLLDSRLTDNDPFVHSASLHTAD